MNRVATHLLHQCQADPRQLRNSKPKRTRQKKKLLNSAMFVLAASLSSSFASAQVVPCAGAVTQVNAGAFTATQTDDAVVNTDMLQHDATGKTIKVIAYGRRFAPTPTGTGSADAYIYASDWNGNTITFQPSMPNACRPDIVLASDDLLHNLTGMPISYKAIVVYVSGTDLYYEIFRLDHCGLPIFSAASVTGPIPLNTTATLVSDAHLDPHIDMWSDPSAIDQANGIYPAMWDFAIVWAEGVRSWPSCLPTPTVMPSPLPINAKDLKYIVDNANTPSTSPMPANFVVSGVVQEGNYIDVACVTDMSGPTQLMEVVYSGTCSSGLNHLEWDPNASASVTSTMSITSNDVFAPRIEAMSIYRGGAIKWQIVTPEDNLTMSPHWQIWGYNSSASANWLSNMYSAVGSSDCKGACVAAGVEATVGSGIGNLQYTAGFYPRQLDTIHERSISAATGAVDPRWWNVNCPSDPVNYHWDAARSVAVTNCSNTGLNLLTAWYDGANIQYKESPNTMLFRQQPTGIETAQTSRLSISPNPVTHSLQLRDAANARFRICDMTGRELIKGTVPANGLVVTENLSIGLYLLEITKNDGNTQATRFVKQ